MWDQRERRETDVVCVSTRSRIMSYPRSSGNAVSSRRAQRPNSFSGTRSSPVSISVSSTPSMRNLYSSMMPGVASSYGSYGSSGIWSTPSSSYPTSVSYHSSHPSSLMTTYGGTSSGYGSLTLPNPNSGYPSSYHSYHAARAPSPSSYSPRSSWSGATSYTSSLSSPKTDFTPLFSRSTSSAGSTRSVASEGYVVNEFNLIVLACVAR